MSRQSLQVEAKRHPHVLLAGIDSKNSTHLKTILNKIGYQVTTVTNGTDAHSILSSEDAPPLAILDSNMPGISGIELCRKLHESPGEQYVYLIVLTTWNEPNGRIQALEAGADDCLPSPVDMRELQLRLEKGSQIILARALRESKERFRSAFECAGIGMAVVKSNGELTQVNRALCDFLGYAAEDLISLNLHDVAHSEEAQTSKELLEQFFKSTHRGGIERRFITRSGDFVWAAYTISSVVDADKNATSFVLQVQDITERKKTDEALRRSEEFLRAITDNINDLIFVLNEENRWLYASPSHSVNLGYEPGELVGTDAVRLVHPADHKLVESTTHELVQSGLPKTIQLRLQHKNNQWHHFEGHLALLRNPNGDVEGIVGVARPIDDRILAEQKLQAAYAETELFLQSIPSILIGLDSAGNITRWNQTATKNLGMAAENVQGLPFDNCGIKWVHPDMKGEVQRWLQTETLQRCDSLALERDGKTRFLGLNVRRISLPNDSSTVGFIVTGADITERKLLEDQLRQAQKLEAIGQLSAGVAHEMNTPIQYVSDNVRFLKDSWEDVASLVRLSQNLRKAAESGAVQKDILNAFDKLCEKADVEYLLREVPSAIDQSIEGAQRVAKIVRAIKEFSHPGSMEKKEVDLNKTIETTITVSRNEWKYVADVDVEFDRELPLVPCLSGELSQVVLNLIVNAAHAITDKVGADSSQKGRITVSTRKNGHWAEIDIKDTGKGIPPGIRSRVFEPFFTTKEVGKGTGQGLALAHSVIVKKHHGQLWFDSEEGLGTTFHIRLPLETSAAETTAEHLAVH